MYAGRGSKNWDTTTWCAGLPLVEERRLDREEQEQLRRTAWKLLGRGLGLCFGLTVLGVLLSLLLWQFAGAWGGTMIVITFIVSALLLLLLANLFVTGSNTQRGLLLFRDLHRGSVVVFGGTLTDADLLQTEDGEDAAQSDLLARGLLDLECADFQSVEVLPVSKSVWRVSGERVIPWVETRWRQVAALPEGASPWLHSPVAAATEGELARRRLSERERAELRREAHQHWRRPGVLAFLLTVVALPVSVFILVTYVTAGNWTAAGIPWHFLHLIFATVAVDIFFARRWQQAREMYRDLRGGEVVVSAENPAAEILPHSGRLWAQSGRPASWRRIGK